MKRKVTAILLVLCMASSVVLGGCSNDKNEGGSATDNELSKNPVEGGSIVVGISQDVDGLDPHMAESAGTREVLFNIYEGLVKPDSDGVLQDAVASDHGVSEDAKVLSF